MKPEHPSPRKAGAGRRKNSSAGIHPIPMEWMDPMSWRLPSGKALAEFALQAGFLAPLLLRAPKVRPAAAVDSPLNKKQVEVPEHSGSFRQTR